MELRTPGVHKRRWHCVRQECIDATARRTSGMHKRRWHCVRQECINATARRTSGVHERDWHCVRQECMNATAIALPAQVLRLFNRAARPSQRTPGYQSARFRVSPASFSSVDSIFVPYVNGFTAPHSHTGMPVQQHGGIGRTLRDGRANA